MPSVDEICWKFLQAFKQGIQDLVLQKPQNLIWALERSYAAAQHSNKNYSCTNKAQSMSAQIDQPWLSLYFKLLFRDKQLLLLLRKLLLLVQRKAGKTQGTICSALILGRLSGFELYDIRTAKIHLIKLHLNIWKGYFVHQNSFVLSRVSNVRPAIQIWLAKPLHPERKETSSIMKKYHIYEKFVDLVRMEHTPKQWHYVRRSRKWQLAKY